MVKDDDKTTKFIQQLILHAELPRDALPYTDLFKELKIKYEAEFEVITNHDFWLLLTRIGKKGGFIPKGAKRKVAPKSKKLTDDQALEIMRLFPMGIGGRDDLPYTGRFDQMHRQFNKITGAKLSKHDFWRAVSTLAKRSRKPKPVLEEIPLGKLGQGIVDQLIRFNPWWLAQPGRRTPDFRRWAYYDVLGRLQAGIASIISMRGPRQVGKSTIQEQIIEQKILQENIDPKLILRVQFDETPALGTIANPIESIIKWYEKYILGKSLNQAARDGDPAFLFYDEIQQEKDWAIQLKSIVDSSDVQIMVTGSSALQIAAAQDSLAGRLSSVELGPLRLYEIARLHNLGLLSPFSSVKEMCNWKSKEFWLSLIESSQENGEVITKAFELFSQFGGYPLCHTKDVTDESILGEQLVEQVVERTITHEPAGVSEDIVRVVFERLCVHAGERVSDQTLINEVNLRFSDGVAKEQLRKAISYLESTMLVRFLEPAQIRRKKTSSPSTICLCDHFLRNVVLKERIPINPDQLKTSDDNYRSTQAGNLVEGIVGSYFASIPGVNAMSFPGTDKHPEVDVVLSIGAQYIPLEVKYQNKVNANSDIKGVKYFCEKHGAPFGLVVTQTLQGEIAPNVIAVPLKILLTLL